MLLALLGIPLGVIITWKGTQIGDVIGEIDWCERFIGAGGTYTFIKLGGIFISVLSLMWLTGTPQEFLRNSVGHLF